MSEPAASPFAETTATHQDASSLRVWALVLAAGLLAGLTSWLVGEAFHNRLQSQLLSTGGMPTAEQARESASGIRRAVTLQTTLAFGSLGAALGLALGLTGGTIRRSARSSMIGAIFGTSLGGIAGALVPLVLLPVYFQFYDPDSDDLVLALLFQGAIGAIIGAVGGAAYALGNRSHIVQALLGGLLGAVAGVLIYEVVGTLVFPLDQTTKPVSATAVSRLLGRLSIAALASAGAAKGIKTTPKANSRPATT